MDGAPMVSTAEEEWSPLVEAAAAAAASTPSVATDESTVEPEREHPSGVGKRLRKIFARADRNNDGRLSRAELSQRLRVDTELHELLQMPAQVLDQDRGAFEALFQGMDTDDSRGVDVEEFVAYLKEVMARAEDPHPRQFALTGSLVSDGPGTEEPASTSSTPSTGAGAAIGAGPTHREQQLLLAGLREELAAEYPHLDEATIQEELEASRGTRMIVPAVPLPGLRFSAISSMASLRVEGATVRCIATEEATAMCTDEPLLRGVSTAFFSLLRSRAGEIGVGIARPSADCVEQAKWWVSTSAEGWVYCVSNGELEHRGRGQSWKGMAPAGQGDTVALTLNHATGTLSVAVNGTSLGVACTGLSGEFCWCVQLYDEGDEVRISSEPPPPVHAAPAERVPATPHRSPGGDDDTRSTTDAALPVRTTLAAMVKSALESTDPVVIDQAADCYIACVESYCDSAATLSPGDPVAEQRLRDAEEVIVTEGQTLYNAGVPRCDDVTNGRLSAKVNRLKAMHMMSRSNKPRSRALAARALKTASRAIIPVLKLDLTDHVALSAVHSMQACLHMENSSSSSRAPVFAQYATQHAGAAANLALKGQHRSTAKAAANELHFLSTRLAQNRLPLSAAQMQQHAHCIKCRLSVRPRSAATGPRAWCQCDACTANQRASPSFARLAAPTIPRGSVTVIADADMGFVCNDQLVVTKTSQDRAVAGVQLGMQLSAFHGAGALRHWVLSQKEMKEFTLTKKGIRNQTSTTSSNWRSLIATCKSSPRPWTFTFSPCSGEQPPHSDPGRSTKARRKTRPKTRRERRPIDEPSDVSTSRTPTPPLEPHPHKLMELQATAATLGTAAGVSTFADSDTGAASTQPVSSVMLSRNNNEPLPWTQRKRAAVVRLQQQLSEAKQVLAQHKGIGRLMGMLEAERNKVDPPHSDEDGGHQEDNSTADDAPADDCPDSSSSESRALQDVDPSVRVDLGVLQSEMRQNDEQQRINDAAQEDLSQRVERLQAKLDKDEQEEAEQRKLIFEIRARAEQRGSRVSNAHGHVAAGAPHPTAYNVLEKSLQQHDIILKKTVARSQALKAQLAESREAIKNLKISNKRLQNKSLKSAHDLKVLQQQQCVQNAQVKRLLAAADTERSSGGADALEFKTLLTRLEEAEQALADQSSGEELILKQLASLTKANEAAKAADTARRKLVASLTAQLKSSKYALKQAQKNSTRERDRLQRTNTELADAASANARSAAAARKKLREMEERLVKAQASHDQEVVRATKELKLQAKVLASEKSQALEKVKVLEEHHERGKSDLKTLQSMLRDAKNEVAILQQDLTEVRTKAAKNQQVDLQAEVDRAREEMEQSLRTAKRKEESAREAEHNAKRAAEKQAELEQQNQEQQDALEQAKLALMDARRKQIHAERSAQALQASLTASDNERKQWQALLNSSAQDGIHHPMIGVRTSNSGASSHGTDAHELESVPVGPAHGQADSVPAQNTTSSSTLAFGAALEGFVIPKATHGQPTERDSTHVSEQRLRKPEPPSTAPAAVIIDCSSSIRAHGRGGSGSGRRRLVRATSGVGTTIPVTPSAATECLTERVPTWGQAFSVASDVKCRRPSSARRWLAPSEVAERAIYRFFVPPP